MNTRVFFVTLLVLLIAVTTAAWATDFVTLESEWTIYTANCSSAWQANHCTGKLLPGDRHRFRALKAHREVLYWTAGDMGESGRFVRCDIMDGRNWACPANPGSPPAITRRMVRGIPDPDKDADRLPFHRIAKVRWVALTYGIPVGGSAAN